LPACGAQPAVFACHPPVYRGSICPREAARPARAFPTIGTPVFQPNARFIPDRARAFAGPRSLIRRAGCLSSSFARTPPAGPTGDRENSTPNGLCRSWRSTRLVCGPLGSGPPTHHLAPGSPVKRRSAQPQAASSRGTPAISRRWKVTANRSSCLRTSLEKAPVVRLGPLSSSRGGVREEGGRRMRAGPTQLAGTPGQAEHREPRRLALDSLPCFSAWRYSWLVSSCVTSD
jgi:hypothetical protein